jgi:hypothetical protein
MRKGNLQSEGLLPLRVLIHGGSLRCVLELDVSGATLGRLLWKTSSIAVYLTSSAGCVCSHAELDWVLAPLTSLASHIRHFVRALPYSIPNI